MARQEQRRKQLDHELGAEDTALLEQKGVLEPAIPQLSSIRRKAGAVVGAGDDRNRGALNGYTRNVLYIGQM